MKRRKIKKTIKVSRFSLGLEKRYAVWLRSIYKSFWAYSSVYLVRSLQEGRDFGNFVPREFMKKLSYDVIDDLIAISFNKLLKDFKTSIPGVGVVTRLTEFRKNSVESIEKNIEAIYEVRKTQLTLFRESSLFTGTNAKVFLEKYKKPKFKFTETTSRTDINNLNRDLSISQAQSLGLTEGIWSTSGDERVRKSHRKLQGKKVSFMDLPVEYNDYNCRCVILPIVST